MIRRTLPRLALALVVLLMSPAVHGAVDDLTEVVPAGSPVVYYIADLQASEDPVVHEFLTSYGKEPFGLK